MTPNSYQRTKLSRNSQPVSRIVPLLWASLLCIGCATTGDLRRVAAQDLGCDEGNIVVYPQQRRASATGCGRTARYQKICEDSVLSDLPSCSWVMVDAPQSQRQLATIRPEAATPPASSGDKSAPTEALGFVFGQDVEAIETACEEAGHRFTVSKQADATFYCDGPAVRAGVQVRESLKFCEGSLCQVVALAELAANEDGDRKLSKLLTGLVDRYGRPDLSRTQISQACGKRTARCIHDGQARWDSTWRWTRGRYLHVTAKPVGDGIILRLEYFLEEQSNAPENETSDDVNPGAF